MTKDVAAVGPELRSSGSLDLGALADAGEDSGDGFGERNRAPGLARLRFEDSELTVDPRQRPADLHQSFPQVDVVPREGERLATTNPGVQQELE